MDYAPERGVLPKILKISTDWKRPLSSRQTAIKVACIRIDIY